MADIYGIADRVLVRLGEETQNTGLAMDAIIEIGYDEKLHWVPPSDECVGQLHYSGGPGWPMNKRTPNRPIVHSFSLRRAFGCSVRRLMTVCLFVQRIAEALALRKVL
jgi:hypothetical protein